EDCEDTAPGAIRLPESTNPACDGSHAGFGSYRVCARRLPELRSEVLTADRPCTDALSGEHVLGDADLLLARGVARGAGATVGLPGALRELQAAVVAVTGVDRPVATALALCDGIPVAGCGVGGTGTQGERGRNECSGGSEGAQGALDRELCHVDESFPAACEAPDAMGPPHMAGRSVPATRCGADTRPVALSLHP